MGCASSVAKMPEVQKCQSSADVFHALTAGRDPARIALVEERGLLTRQLQALVDFMASRTTGDEDLLVGWTDPRNGDSLRLSSINLYQLTHWVIKPLTARARCSFVEAVATEPTDQRPQWFASHWWGEAVVDFLKCIKHHLKVRGLQEPSAYWVCAYANNQHELGTELGTDPMQSSFLKAMQMCHGILLILDPLATPFTRVWCCFEEGLVALASRGLVETKDFHHERDALRDLAARDGLDGRRPPLLLDIATIDKELNPQLLTDGMTAKEQEMEKGHEFHFSMPSGWKAKSKREASFPLEVIKHGLQVDISKSTASMEIDRTRIINALAGASVSDLDKPPVEDHRNVHVVNEVLRATFAIAGWRQALSKKVDISDDGSLPLARALSGDTQRQRLDLSILKDVVKEQEQVHTLAKAVAPLTSLLYLHLDFSNCQDLVNTTILSNSLACLTQLQDLFLHFTSCGVNSAEFAGCLASSLKKLDLSFQFCSGLSNTSIEELGAGLSRLRDLEVLDLNLDCCDHVSSLDGLGEGFRGLLTLRILKLDISRLSKLRSLDGLGSGMSALAALEDLWVQTSFNKAMSSIAQFGKSLAHMPLMQNLELNFQYCSQIESIEELGQSLSNLGRLKHLRLGLNTCSALASVKGLTRGISSLDNLADFSIELNRCERLGAGDIADLVRASTKLHKLEVCYFALFECKQLGKELVYGFGLEERDKLLSLLAEAEGRAQ